MAAKQKKPVVVAELGRPETPAETAARKARDSQLYRQRKTVNNLVFSLLVSVALMVGIVLMAPGLIGGKSALEERNINVAELANQSADSAGRALAAPQVPKTWKARAANLRRDDGIVYWQIHYTAVSKNGTESYASVLQAYTPQGKPASARWLQNRLEQLSPTGAAHIGGRDWVAYSYPERSAAENNVRFAFTTELDGQSIAVFGTASKATIASLAKRTLDSLQTTK